MKKLLISTLVFSLVIACQSKESVEPNPVRIPGEFEPQEAIWLGYKTRHNHGTPDDSISKEMIKAIHPFVKVNLIIENDTLVGDVLQELHKEGIDTSKIELVFQANADIWYRDPGPIFAVEDAETLKIVDFKYTNYHNIIHDSIDDLAKAYEALDRDIANRMGIETISSKVALEGGAFETNGKGVLIQVEKLTLGRNPHLTKLEIEAEFKECCGIEKVIWLPSGLADDPQLLDRIHNNIMGVGTGGHTDEFVRFANDSTILLSWVNKKDIDTHPIKKLNFEILSKNYEILSQATDLEGNSFDIIKVPRAEPMLDTVIVEESFFEVPEWKKNLDRFGFKPKDTFYWSITKSYLNYIITNNVVLVPELQDQNDIVVKDLFKKVFPDRKMVGINPHYFENGGYGGMHCRSQTQPKID